MVGDVRRPGAVRRAAGAVQQKRHDRMPVIVDPDDYGRWLDPATPTEILLPLRDSRPVDRMQVVAVNPAVNNPRKRGAELLDTCHRSQNTV